MGSNERNLPEAKARSGPSERARASHWAGVRSRNLFSVCSLPKIQGRVTPCAPAQTTQTARSERRAIQSIHQRRRCGWPKHAAANISRGLARDIRLSLETEGITRNRAAPTIAPRRDGKGDALTAASETARSSCFGFSGPWRMRITRQAQQLRQERHRGGHVAPPGLGFLLLLVSTKISLLTELGRVVFSPSGLDCVRCCAAFVRVRNHLRRTKRQRTGAVQDASRELGSNGISLRALPSWRLCVGNDSRPPSPRPSPPGEGESFAASWPILRVRTSGAAAPA